MDVAKSGKRHSQYPIRITRSNQKVDAGPRGTQGRDVMFEGRGQ